MKDIDKIVKAAMTALLTVTTLTALTTASGSATTDNMEKCYGIVKTGQNDCQTATTSCAGSAVKDNEPDAFIFLPKGDCSKITGGNLQAPAAKKSKS
jgi:uncharacterized membrane protein